MGGEGGISPEALQLDAGGDGDGTFLERGSLDLSLLTRSVAKKFGLGLVVCSTRSESLTRSPSSDKTTNSPCNRKVTPYL